METVWKDVRFAVRTWLKRPGFTLIAVLTAALGIGATASIFSVVNGVLLQPLPLEKPEQLVAPDVISSLGYEISLSIPNFKDWRERNRTLETFTANARRSATLTGGDRPEVIITRWVLGDWFETLGVQPALGRTFSSDESWAGAEPVAVVTDGFWKRWLGGGNDALGRTIAIDSEVFTVIGVMPSGFAFPSADTEVFLPMGFFSERMCWEARGCSQGTWAIGRLKDGVTLEAAQTDFERIARELGDEEGEEMAVARMTSLTDAYVGDLRPQVWILMGAVSFVLLIACANVAGLLLSRGESRRREIAVRTALGAGRWRVVRQLITESMVLALAGGLLGIGLARWGVWSMAPWVSENVPSLMAGRVELDGMVLAFTVIVTAVAGLLFGLAPAIRASRPDLAQELKEGGRDTGGRARQRLRSVLVAAEVGLSLVLLIGAGLMIQSLTKLANVEKGFVGDNVLTARVSLPAVQFSEKEPTWRFYDRLLERVQALPGVRAASVSNIVPLGGNSWERGIFPEGVATEAENANSVLFHMVSRDHFDVLGIPLLKGRAFEETDVDEGHLVAIIDDTMAERFWPGEDPIGKRVTFESRGEGDEEERIWRTVVGVTKNVRHYELENASRVQVYIPTTQSGESWTRGMMILAQTAGDPRTLTEPVRRVVSELHPDVPLSNVETMEGYVAEALSPTQAVSGLLTVFSAVALVLASIGVFGVISFSVMQRLREFGIHMALGARGSDVLRMVTRQGMLITLSGIVLGLVAAFALTRLMTSVLYEVEPVDPLTFGSVAAFLVGVALLASYIPARRATRVDPSIVLRDE